MQNYKTDETRAGHFIHYIRQRRKTYLRYTAWSDEYAPAKMSATYRNISKLIIDRFMRSLIKRDKCCILKVVFKAD